MAVQAGLLEGAELLAEFLADQVVHLRRVLGAGGRPVRVAVPGGDVDRPVRAVDGVEAERAAQTIAGAEGGVGVPAEQGRGGGEIGDGLQVSCGRLRDERCGREQHPGALQEVGQLDPGDVLGAQHDVVVHDVDGDAAHQVGDGGRLGGQPVVQRLQFVAQLRLGAVGVLDGESGVLGGLAGGVVALTLGQPHLRRAVLLEPHTGEHGSELLPRRLGEAGQLLAAGSVRQVPLGAHLQVPGQRLHEFVRQRRRLDRGRFGLGDGGGGAEQHERCRTVDRCSTGEGASHGCLPR